MAAAEWNPELYADKHSFVWKLSSSLVELLKPEANERILDLGCGTGQLTSQIAESGAEVHGLDKSTDMITSASRSFPNVQFSVADAHDFVASEPFDAVFSNAALHWVSEPDRVVKCIAKALKPSGRLVVEFGGAGNVNYLSTAIEEAFQAVVGRQLSHPWYFPDVATFSSLLAEHQIEVVQAAMIDRPTVLEGDEGLQNWVRMFGRHWLDCVPAKLQDYFLERVELLAARRLKKADHWVADYRRIRIVARNWCSS